MVEIVRLFCETEGGLVFLGFLTFCILVTVIVFGLILESCFSKLINRSPAVSEPEQLDDDEEE